LRSVHLRRASSKFADHSDVLTIEAAKSQIDMSTVCSGQDELRGPDRQRHCELGVEAPRVDARGDGKEAADGRSS
jgi:hypothetical protein